ncbi:hypothetical protein K491DRAFT_777065 [Lophiostoma macrostomum CBS 122681]|uniref:Uncharacterized protein n=1 Tax=Lophiostoma macrostomum CBS 122681 TaxID=1314788 RepID=A0A6A6TCE8_9PLEO|nr:hypothetical protein K491DRAFT_777065 [Lophiostoma macrostomum CBS 122681]
MMSMQYMTTLDEGAHPGHPSQNQLILRAGMETVTHLGLVLPDHVTAISARPASIRQQQLTTCDEIVSASLSSHSLCFVSSSSSYLDKMAEFAAIGAAASILQLIDFATTAIGRLREYQNRASEVPRTIQQITVELPILAFTLKRLQEAFHDDFEGKDNKCKFLPAIKECGTAIRELNDILSKITPETSGSWRGRGGKAFHSLRKESQLKDSLKSIRRYVRVLTDAATHLQFFKNTDLTKLRDWVRAFSGPDPSPLYKKAKDRRQAGTSQWFLESQSFAAWKGNDNSLLWLSGIPGCGKSVLSSSVIEHIQERCQDNPSMALGYFFFDFNESRTQYPDAMTSSIVTQLFAKVLKPPARLETYRRSCADGLRQPDPQMRLEILKTLI